MNIVSINQDSGIDESRKKGAAVHLRAIRKAFGNLGHSIRPLDCDHPAHVQRKLEAFHQRQPIHLVYERYALGMDAGATFAAQHELPFVLEVNAPLAEEAADWRGYEHSQVVDNADRNLFSKARCVIAVSEQTAEYAQRRGTPASRITVCANGVDTDVFFPRDRARCKAAVGIDPRSFVLGFHGRLRPWHGFETLVTAVSRLQANGLPVHLLTVGEGPYLAQMQGRLAPGCYTHLPWLDQLQLGAVVAAYDVLPLMYEPAAPCYFSPLKLYEAMASGAVPVVPDTGDLGLVVRDQYNGLLYRDRKLTETIATLWKQPALQRALRDNAVHCARAHTWSAVARKTLDAAGLSATTPGEEDFSS